MVACNPTFDQTRVCKVVFVTSWAFDTSWRWHQERQQVARPYPRPPHGVPTWRSLPGEDSPAATWARLLPWPTLPPCLSDGLWGSGLEDLLEKPCQRAEQSAREEGWALSPGNAPGGRASASRRCDPVAGLRYGAACRSERLAEAAPVPPGSAMP